MFKPFYLIWTPKGNSPTKQHNTPEEAEQEAHRLTEKHPDRQFFVLQSVGKFYAEPVKIIKDYVDVGLEERIVKHRNLWLQFVNELEERLKCQPED